MQLLPRYSHLSATMMALALWSTASAVRADAVSVGTGRYEGTIVGIRNGKLAMMLKATGMERDFELADITAMEVDAVPKFAEAEGVRGDVLKGVKAYRELVAAVNKPELRVVAQWRAIEPLDKAGQWVEAVGMFLEVYGASPVEGVWKVRPTRMPGAGSKMLSDAADKVAAAAKGAKSEEVRKNLRGWLLEMFTKAGDTAAAQRVAREMAGVEEMVPVRAVVDQTAAAGVAEVEAAVRGKDFAGAVKKADALLGNVTGETAVAVFALKAQALEGMGKDEDAAGTWLRVVAHYPGSARAAEGLLRAGELEKKLGHAEAAKVLFREVVEKYPTSKEAGVAKGR